MVTRVPEGFNPVLLYRRLRADRLARLALESALARDEQSQPTPRASDILRSTSRLDRLDRAQRLTRISRIAGLGRVSEILPLKLLGRNRSASAKKRVSRSKSLSISIVLPLLASLLGAIGIEAAAPVACTPPAQASPLYAHFLFLPRREMSYQPEQIDGIAREDVSISVKPPSRKHKAIDLSGWYFHNSKSPYVVLVSHGNAGNISSMSWIAHNLLSASPSVLLYDYRGYGKSPGKPSVKSICADGEAAYDFLVKDKGYRPDQIFLYGQSLGCAVASHISSNHGAAGLILQSGFSSLRTVANERFPILRPSIKALVPDVLDNAKILSRSKLPLLIIHGDEDQVVPFDNAHILYDAAAQAESKELVVCHHSGHCLYPESDAQHRDAVQKFIAQVIAAHDTTTATGAAKTSSAQPAPAAAGTKPDTEDAPVVTVSTSEPVADDEAVVSVTDPGLCRGAHSQVKTAARPASSARSDSGPSSSKKSASTVRTASRKRKADRARVAATRSSILH